MFTPEEIKAARAASIELSLITLSHRTECICALCLIDLALYKLSKGETITDYIGLILKANSEPKRKDS